MSKAQCPSVHALGGMQCIREAGHDGRCWCNALMDSTGAMTRGEWQSENGVFKKHYGYITSYTNPKLRNKKSEPHP